MNYLFKKLEDLCFKAIIGYNKIEDLRSIDSIQREVTTLKKTMKGIYHEPHGVQNFEMFTNAHHKSLIDLFGEIKIRLPTNLDADDIQFKKSFPGFLEKISAPLEDLLRFIHRQFQEYIDQRKPIPEVFKAAAIIDVEQMLQHLVPTLASLENPNLTEILLKPFYDFIHTVHKTTFHNLLYCRILNGEILRNCNKPDFFNTNSIINLMIYMNCNSTPAKQYIIKFICQEPCNDNELRNFNFWLKQIRQADLKANIAYKVNRPNLSVMLEKWITEEIGYLKKSAKTSLKDQELSKATDMINPKILSSLSVPELALYFKLMIDMKFIQVENLQDFFRHITRTYRTKNTENISFESIRSKFYQPENATIKAVKSKLIEALNQINLLS